MTLYGSESCNYFYFNFINSHNNVCVICAFCNQYRQDNVILAKYTRRAKPIKEGKKGFASIIDLTSIIIGPLFPAIKTNCIVPILRGIILVVNFLMGVLRE